MAPIANRPWLEHLILHLKAHGLDRFVIAMKHYPDKIRDYFGDGRKLGVSIQYVLEKQLLGTAGAIKNAEPYLDERFIVFNADIVHNVDLQPLLAFHESHGGGVTIGLKEVDDPTQYGVVEQDETGRILRFVEKPRLEEAPSKRINAGIYIMDRDVLAAIPANREVSIERETFPLLVEQKRVYGQTIRGYWMDMGTKERYRQVHWDLLSREFQLPLSGMEREEGIWVGRNTRIGTGAMLVPPVLIGDRVTIGDRCVIGPNVVIGDDCHIGPNARLSETILWDRCTVRDGAHLNNCIFGYDLELGSGHIIYEAVMNRMGVV
jgi:mannose-1-phosphate guanylyltransferase